MEISPKCYRCKAIHGLWFSERLGEYVCPSCLDKEVVLLDEQLDKALGLLETLGTIASNLMDKFLAAKKLLEGSK